MLFLWKIYSLKFLSEKNDRYKYQYKGSSSKLDQNNTNFSDWSTSLRTVPLSFEKSSPLENNAVIHVYGLKFQKARSILISITAELQYFMQFKRYGCQVVLEFCMFFLEASQSVKILETSKMDLFAEIISSI